MADEDDSNNPTGDDWSSLPIADFAIDARRTIQFLLKNVRESGSLRAAKRDRPFQKGAKLDNVGPNSDDFALTVIFHNDLDEPGLSADFQQYPNALDEIMDQFHVGDTGTLNLPWKRGIRCKAVTWSRVENADDTRGGAMVDIQFTTDNEDTLDREAFQKVSVKASADSSVQAAQFDCDSTNMFDGSIEDITELAANLVGLLNTPGEFLGTIIQAANRVRRAVKFLIDGFEHPEIPGRDMMSDPDSSSARAKLFDLLELAGQAEGDALAAQPKTRTIKYTHAVDIYSVAAELGQSSRTLISINDDIPDLSYIPPGTPIRILAQ